MIAHAVRYMSVDSCRDPDSAGLRWTSPAADSLAREPENAQATGRFRRWWRMLGSNQRRLSRRFYRPNLAGSSRTADLVAAHDAILPPEFRDSSRQFPCFQFLNSVFPRHGDRLSLCASAWGRRPAGDRTPPELHRGIRWALYAKPKRHDGPGSLLAGHAAHQAGPVTVRDGKRFAGPPSRTVAVRYMSAAVGSSNM